MLLSECRTGCRTSVIRIDTDAKIRRHLLVLGIFPGASLRIVRRNAGGTVIVSTGGVRYALSHSVASRISVCTEGSDE